MDGHDSLSRFLRRCLPLVEATLQENETVDIFRDILRYGDSVYSGGGTSNGGEHLREVRNFTDLEYSKGKRLTCIDWHPINPDVIAASACDQVGASSSDERVAAVGAPPHLGGENDDSATDASGLPSHVVIWERGTGLHPRAVLRAPLECPVFRFNPTRPDLVVGGCTNGQLALWEVAAASSERGICGDENDPSDPSAVRVAGGRRGGGVRMPPLGPIALSHPEHGHKRAVEDLVWLPADGQVSSFGE